MDTYTCKSCPTPTPTPQQACTTPAFDGSCPDGTYPDGAGVCCAGGFCDGGALAAPSDATRRTSRPAPAVG